MVPKRAILVLAFALSTVHLGPAPAARAYPERPVQVIVPFGAGGIPDMLARALGERLAKLTGQPFFVENRPGAGGNVGGELVARAAPDGHHLLMAPSNVLTVNPVLYPQLRFDPASAFAPVSLVAEMPVLFLVRANLGPRTVSEFLDKAKSEPQPLFLSSPGSGSSLHLAMELFKQTAGIPLQHVPYRSGPEALTAVVGGQAAGMFANLPFAVGQIQAGKVIALAVSAPRRMAQLPEVPTLSEAGLPGAELSSWFGLVAPARTQAWVVDALSELTAKALREPDLQRRLGDLGVQLVGSRPGEFATFIAEERAKGERIVRSAGIKLH